MSTEHVSDAAVRGIDPTPDYTLKQVSVALGMSERWIRARVAEGAAHQRYGHKIRFTEEQLAQLRAAHTQQPAGESITTGRKRKSA